ncbi:MAG: phage major capsid protein [Flammeovirgaceae bacterium]|nr:phage major capsid protein [Flammeovirgaceae bacterium]
MASVTLAESAKLEQDMLIQGIIENVIMVDHFFDVLPFEEITGNALAYNRENALGDVQWTTVGTTITAKAAATFTQVTSSLTTLLGDAEVNGLIQATRSNINDQTAVQVGSKAKSIGLAYTDKLINGTGASNEINGFLDLVTSGQTIDAATNGAALSFVLLDQLLDQVTDKNGIVDFMIMHSRTLRSYYALLRALGGASVGEVVTLPSGAQVPGYRGTPIFRNNNVPINQTHGTETAATSVIAGNFDDGSFKFGVSGLTAMGAAGVRIEDVGTSETKDEKITRVKMYTGLANYNSNGLAIVEGINN